VEGIGEDFVPKTFNSQLVDEWIRVSDAESFHAARSLARREGILVGGSSGTAVAAALRYARRLVGEHMVVALCADTGRNYMSKMFDDEWLAANKLTVDVQPAHSIGDLLRQRGPRSLVTITPRATAAEAIEHDEKDPSQVTIGEIMARPLPQVETTVHLDEAYRLLLAGNTGVLAVEDGQVVGIVTRIDLIQYWSQTRRQ
jgi:cystathionine beta-synthase